MGSFFGVFSLSFLYNYLSAFYHRIAPRRGKQKAIMALCHKVLVILYHLWRDKKHSTDLGAKYF